MANHVFTYEGNNIIARALSGDGGVPKYLSWATTQFTATRSTDEAMYSLYEAGGGTYERTEGVLSIETTSQEGDTLVCSGTITANDGPVTLYGAGWHTSDGLLGVADFSPLQIPHHASVSFVWRLQGK